MQEIRAACLELGLGECVDDPVSQAGGSLHSMWYVRTEQGEFAVKKINQNNLNLLGRRIVSLQDSHQQSGLPFTIQRYQGHDWLIRKWVQGQCLAPHECTVEQAAALGDLVKECHARQSVLNVDAPDWHSIELAKWQRLIKQAEQKQLVWAPQYRDALPKIAHWIERINASTDVFIQNTLISHRDISHSNIIWSKHKKPILIDWEFAGRIHPELECFIVMMNFEFTQPDKKKAFLTHYGKAISLSDELLTVGYLGYCLDWLEFNMERSLYYPQQQRHSDPQLINYLSFLLAQDY